MPTIIDVSYPCGSRAAYLSSVGVRTVIRYYSRDTGIPEKRLTVIEANALAAAGLRIGIVHEARHGDRIGSFSAETGALDAAYCLDYATKTIDQPEGSAIYFAVDFDASLAELTQSIVPYFQAVASFFARSPRKFKVGVYGSGRTCQEIVKAKLCDHSWLAQSVGWAEYNTYLNSNNWSLRQLMPTKVGEIRCDPDINNGDFGDFSFAASGAATENSKTVIARAGVRLRAGPGLNYDVLRVVPYRTRLNAIKTVGEWTMVDLNGDGAADGFLSEHYLQ